MNFQVLDLLNIVSLKIRFSLSKYYVKELLDFESQINFNIHPQNQLNDDYDTIGVK